MKDVYVIGDCVIIWDNFCDDINYIVFVLNVVCIGIVVVYNVCGIEFEGVGV